MKTLSLTLLSTVAVLSSHAGMDVEESCRDRAPRYRVVDLGVAPGRANTYVINAHCLNNRGQVVGWSNDGAPYDFQNDSAFLWSPSQGLRTLPSLANAATALAVALNDAGDIVGFSGDPFPASTPTVWTRRGPQALAIPAGYQGGLAFGINNRGLIGGGLLTDDGRLHPFVWKDGVPRLLPQVGDPATSEGSCYMVGDRGLIVGSSDLKPAVWKNGQVIGLGTFGGERGQANGVNDRDQVVGFSEDGLGGVHGFIWENGAMTKLTTDEPYTVALSINNRGQIAGAAGAGNLLGDAVLWQHGQRIILGETLPANSGWVLIEADCINDQGQITGLGMHDGQPRAFLLTPRD
ncbi:MAG: hypothetical protein JNK85_04960 [Verrucomicrobiales bacterium]|nr:hypothetical protein [Verrucomicrobiales bacterium]